MVELRNVYKTFVSELGSKKDVFQNTNFIANEGDFVSIIGSNGAGKSTLLNVINGNVIPDAGEVVLRDRNITKVSRHKRAKWISQVFQNPSQGTSPSMTVLENLSMAKNKGKSFNLTLGLDKKNIPYYKEILASLDLGGQRQCLSLIMSTLNHPDVLLLDEHTAALDPKTSKIILDKTKELVEKNNITTLMITHNLQDAIEYGNRLIMIHDGSIILDLKGEEKQHLTVEKLLEFFHEKDAKLADKDLF